jgi:phenylacetate-CoA ligase
MTLRCEATREDGDLQRAVAESLREVMRLRGEVAFVAAGSLPQDGKLIEDARRYD